MHDLAIERDNGGVTDRWIELFKARLLPAPEGGIEARFDFLTDVLNSTHDESMAGEPSIQRYPSGIPCLRVISVCCETFLGIFPVDEEPALREMVYHRHTSRERAAELLSKA